MDIQDPQTVYQEFKSLFLLFLQNIDGLGLEKIEDQVNDIRNRLEGLWFEIGILGIFSSNEDELDDLSTRSLLFLLVPAMLSELWVNTNVKIKPLESYAEPRIQALEKGMDYVKIFFDFIRQYRIPLMLYGDMGLQKQRETMIFMEDRLVSELHMQDNQIQSESLDTRQIKIWRHKEEKNLFNMLSHNVLLDMDEDKEPTNRDLALKWIELFRLRLIDHTYRIRQELRLLKNKADGIGNISRHSTADSSIGIGNKNTVSKPLKPFILTKDEIQKSVFRPSYRLPTMTIDEYLEKEFQINKALSQDKVSEKKESEDDMLQKQREWDEFKELHPRGSGNRYRHS
jgi:immunoglobulin-binding protein 1